VGSVQVTIAAKENIMADRLTNIEVTGKDIVGSAMPATITSENTAEEFSSGKTWGRLLRLRRDGNQNFFDIGIDKDGNLFINTKQDSATKHVLTITPSGDVRIEGNLTVTGTLQTS
jgi:hypothetical protein